MKQKQFFIEQIAITPPKGREDEARELLSAIFSDNWVEDTVEANGFVHGAPGENRARLLFNYDTTRPDREHIEFEILDYQEGPNWMKQVPSPAVSHIGMHVESQTELAEWGEFFDERGIPIVQEVFTKSHTNPYLNKIGRRYNYVIFGTRDLLGFDLKFILRRERDESTHP